MRQIPEACREPTAHRCPTADPSHPHSHTCMPGQHPGPAPGRLGCRVAAWGTDQARRRACPSVPTTLAHVAGICRCPQKTARNSLVTVTHQELGPQLGRNGGPAGPGASGHPLGSTGSGLALPMDTPGWLCLALTRGGTQSACLPKGQGCPQVRPSTLPGKSTRLGTGLDTWAQSALAPQQPHRSQDPAPPGLSPGTQRPKEGSAGSLGGRESSSLLPHLTPTQGGQGDTYVPQRSY